MARRKSDRATTAILEYGRKLERESNAIDETITFGAMYLFFTLLDLCTITLLTRALLGFGRRGHTSTHWKALLLAANSSLSHKVRGKSFFYLGSMACEFSERLDRDPVRSVQTAFFFFTKSLGHDPDDCWSRKCRAELYSAYGEGNLHLKSMYTPQDALADAKEALEFFRSTPRRHESIDRMVKQCEQVVTNLTEAQQDGVAE